MNFEIPVAAHPPRTTTSADGTVIAFDVHGDPTGDTPIVVCVGGATNTRLMWTAFGRMLAERGLVGVTYDWRGRGDSGDTAPYAVACEVDDISAVVEAVRPGGRVTALGFSSGAALVVQAVAGGAPIDREILMEPPYRVEGSPSLPEGYADTLAACNAEGRNDDAYEFFMTAAVGMPQDVIDGMKGTEMWAYFSKLAPTLLYDAHCLGGNDHSLPTDVIAGFDLPVVGLASAGSPPFMQDPARLIAKTAPNATFRLEPGEFHTIDDALLADVVVESVRG